MTTKGRSQRISLSLPKPKQHLGRIRYAVHKDGKLSAKLCPLTYVEPRNYEVLMPPDGAVLYRWLLLYWPRDTVLQDLHHDLLW